MTTWQVGHEFTMEVTGLTHEGAGVGRVEDRVVFVPEALPGDLIRLKLVHFKERLAYVFTQTKKSTDSGGYRTQQGIRYLRT